MEDFLYHSSAFYGNIFSLTENKILHILTVSKYRVNKSKGAQVMLYEYLKQNYETGEPIFASDIELSNVSEENLRYHFKKLTDTGIICRFDAGIYYFPKINSFGEKQTMPVETVVLHKYILRRGKRIGYYSGHTLANRMGLSTQVPYTIEITSNLAPAPVREVSIKNRKYVLRRPAMEITEDNVAVLQFLDCLKDLDKCAEEEPEVCGRILSRYALEHGITKSMIDRLIAYYPVKIYKAIYETEVKYVSS